MSSDPLSRYLVHRSHRVERLARLRPMSSSEILDLSFQVYQSLGWTLLKLTALPSLICLAATAFVMQETIPAFFSTKSPTDIGAQVGEAFSALAIGFCIAGPLFLIGLSFSSAAVVSAVSDFMLGRVPDLRSALATARKALPRLFLLNVYELAVGWLFVLAGIVLLMIGGLIPESAGSNTALPALIVGFAILALIVGAFALPLVLIRHALAVPSAVLEGLKPLSAVKRSLRLMRGEGLWHPSGYGTMWMLFVVVGCLIVLVMSGVGVSYSLLEVEERRRFLLDWPVFGALAIQAIELLPWFLAIWTLVPVWCATTTILYFERRIRLEGYDIDALAQDVWRTDRSSRFEL